MYGSVCVIWLASTLKKGGVDTWRPGAPYKILALQNINNQQPSFDSPKGLQIPLKPLHLTLPRSMEQY